MTAAPAVMAINDMTDEVLAWAFLVSAGFTGVTKVTGTPYYRKIDGAEGFSKLAPPFADWYTLEEDPAGGQVTAQAVSLTSMLDRAWVPQFFWDDMVKRRTFPTFDGQRFCAGTGGSQAAADDPASAYMRHRALAHFGSERVEVPGCIIERFECRMGQRQPGGMAEPARTQDDPSP